MNTNTKDFWKEKLNTVLPGEKAHQLFSPPERLVPDADTLARLKPKEAAVLILLFDNGDIAPHTLLMHRVAYNGVHSKQISFPGGKKEPSDKCFSDTAIRECVEEVKANPNAIEIIGELSTLYIPPSNFLVHPYVAWYHDTPLFEGNPHEVERLFSVNISDLNNQNNRCVKNIEVRGTTIECPAFNIDSNIIWGATAMIISELLYVYKMR